MTHTHDDDRFVPAPPYRPAHRHPNERNATERFLDAYAVAYSALGLMALRFGAAVRAVASWVKRNPEHTLAIAGAIMAIIMAVALLWPRGGPLP